MGHRRELCPNNDSQIGDRSLKQTVGMQSYFKHEILLIIFFSRLFGLNMKGSQGVRRRTRGFRARVRDKGKVRIKRYIRDFSNEDRVSIAIDPSYQNIPHPRFQGRSGKVVGKQGRAYFVGVMDGGKEKRILVNPEHLKALK